jgi:hypothetical protein
MFPRITLTALMLTVVTSAQAAVLKDRCKMSIDACGIVFSSIPSTPSLTTANCFSDIPVTYVIENEGAGNTAVIIALVDNDSLGEDAVIIDWDSSTCISGGTLDSLASCTIVLDYQPCDSGTLDRDLTIYPVSTQLPLVVPIETTVGTSAFVYCPA